MPGLLARDEAGNVVGDRRHAEVEDLDGLPPIHALARLPLNRMMARPSRVNRVRASLLRPPTRDLSLRKGLYIATAMTAALVFALSIRVRRREIETIRTAWERRKAPGTSFPEPGPEIGRRP